MIKDVSYGVIPIRIIADKMTFYLVKNKNGHYWGFPKGHPEGDETPLLAAERELIEETGLEVETWLSTEAIEEQYVFGHLGKLIQKTVFYYLAIVTKVAVIQRDEILDGKWVALEEVENVLTYEASKNVFAQAKKILKKKNHLI
jgi:8-oxo-dGTP pyrophosphatase MutT (NUDIX family)